MLHLSKLGVKGLSNQTVIFREKRGLFESHGEPQSILGLVISHPPMRESESTC
jgi:hypothetical protein